MAPQDTQQQLAAFVAHRVVLPSALPLPFAGQTTQPQAGLRRLDGTVAWFTNAEAFANALSSDVGFQALQLGTWLNTPDGELIAAAVKRVVPLTYRPEYQLVVNALRLAASKQQRAGWQRAVGFACLAGLGVAAAFGGRS
jgi:hypothetical protein